MPIVPRYQDREIAMIAALADIPRADTFSVAFQDIDACAEFAEHYVSTIPTEYPGTAWHDINIDVKGTEVTVREMPLAALRDIHELITRLDGQITSAAHKDWVLTDDGGVEPNPRAFELRGLEEEE